MKKLLLLLPILLLMGQAPFEKTSEDVRIKRLEDEIELRRKQTRTQTHTVTEKFYLDKNGKVYLIWNATASQIDFFIDGALVGHVDAATGFVND